VYTAKNVRLELEVAKREFLQASVGIRGDNKVCILPLMHGGGRGELILHFMATRESD
jgi:hypothetical protein